MKSEFWVDYLVFYMHSQTRLFVPGPAPGPETKFQSQLRGSTGRVWVGSYYFIIFLDPT
jgi:hypothetical protein